MLRNINWTKKSGILIIVISLVGLLLMYNVECYRGTWFYKYINLIALIIFYGGVLWSLINTILLISKHKSDLKKNLIWIIISAIPFMYVATMILIAFTADYELERNF